MKKLFYLSILFFLPLVTSAQDYQLTTEKAKVIEDLVKDGYMKFDLELDKAWVSPGIWNQWNVDEKELLTTYAALFIRYKQRDSKSTPMIDLFDYKSGRQVASYGPIRGFRIINP
jgi:hypothetical protein